MGVPTSEVDYTSATTGRGDHEVHKGHVVALEIKTGFLTEVLAASCHYFYKNFTVHVHTQCGQNKNLPNVQTCEPSCYHSAFNILNNILRISQQPPCHLIIQPCGIHSYHCVWKIYEVILQFGSCTFLWLVKDQQMHHSFNVLVLNIILQV
jgi:hypothetical protein